MSLSQLSLLIIFMSINVLILREDFISRKIPNKYIISLFLLLPFWWVLFFPEDLRVLLPHCILFLILIIIGIFSEKEKWFFGGWDIKYWALIILFLSGRSLSVFIGNIWVFTLLILIFWWSMILWKIYTVRPDIIHELSCKRLRKVIRENHFIKSTVFFIFDWIVIGIFLYLAMQDILIEMFQINIFGGQLYSIVAIGIFFLRPSIKNLIKNSKYGFFVIVFIWLYFISKIQANGISYFLTTLFIFIKSIWIYALVFSSLGWITRKTFLKYDALIDKKNIGKSFDTIAYSFVIFLAFIVTFFLDFSFIEWICSP